MKRLLFCGALLFGCASAPPPPKVVKPCEHPSLNVQIIADQRLNPSTNGESRPVQIRIYQLRNDTRFRNSEFEQIWKEDAKTLEADLLAVQEVPVFPCSRKTLQVERKADALFFAVAALYREPQGRTWASVFELTPSSAAQGCGRSGAPDFNVFLSGTNVEDGSERAQDAQAGACSGQAAGP